MPSNIVDSTTWSTPVQTVSDGDAANAANFALAPQALSNRTAYLNSTMMPVSAGMTISGGAFTGAISANAVTTSAMQITGSGALTMNTRTITRALPIAWRLAGSTWTDGRDYITAGLSSAQYACQPLSCPLGSTITGISVRLKGGSGHGALPTYMPQIWVCTLASSGGSYTALSATDSSSDFATFEVEHTISATGSLFVASSAMSYQIYVASESGANAVSGDRVGFSTVTFTTSAVDLGAA